MRQDNATYPDPVDEVRLERIRVGVAQFLYKEGYESAAIDLEARLVESTAHTVGMEFRSYMLALPDEGGRVEWPATWWEHLKQRWFPRWALRRWPVRMESKTWKTFRAVCPHLGVRDSSPHARFFLAQRSPEAAAAALSDILKYQERDGGLGIFGPRRKP